MDSSVVESLPARVSTTGFLSLLEEERKGLLVFYGHPEVHSLAQKFLARSLARGHGAVVLDAGNLFDPYLISTAARALGREPKGFLSKILVSRSFTCHQTHALVRKVASRGREISHLILVLGLLTTFYDEEISLGERAALLKSTLALLKEISRSRGRIFVTCADPPVPIGGRFVDLLLRAADGAARLDLDQDKRLNIRPIKIRAANLVRGDEP